MNTKRLVIGGVIAIAALSIIAPSVMTSPAAMTTQPEATVDPVYEQMFNAPANLPPVEEQVAKTMKMLTPTLTPAVPLPLEADQYERVPLPTDYVDGTVVKWVDGDTLDVKVDGEVVRVRVLGIDAPERGTKDGDRITKAVRNWYPKGTPVMLEVDPGQDKIDRYGRLLRHVFTDSWSRLYAAEITSMQWSHVKLTDKRFGKTKYHPYLKYAVKDAKNPTDLIGVNMPPIYHPTCAEHKAAGEGPFTDAGEMAEHRDTDRDGQVCE